MDSISRMIALWLSHGAASRQLLENLKVIEERMSYHIDADIISLDDLQKRLEKTDLVPSRASLQNGLESIIQILKNHGIMTLAELRITLKTNKRLEILSNETTIDKEYLILLRREIESYFPKPVPLKAFNWLPAKEISKLENSEINNTTTLYNALNHKEELVKVTQINIDILEELIHLSDPTRIQWTSPLAARMLSDAGFRSVQEIASADPESLYNFGSNLRMITRICLLSKI